MRAAIIRKLGADPVLSEIESPPDTPGYSQVRVISGGLQPTDIMRSKGVYNPPEVPYVIGSEGVGLRDRQRVYFGHSLSGFGSLAEYTAVPDAEIWPIADDVGTDQAIALAIAGTGALIPLREARIEKGETVLILGATGPLGQIALQVARLLGAGRVIAAARCADALADIARRGLADQTVQLGQGGDENALRQAGGYDAVLDCIFGEPAQAALRAMRPGGRLMSIGIGAGPVVTLSLADLVQKSVHGVGTGQRSVAERRAAFDTLIGWHREGLLHVPIRRFTLDEIEKAWTLQKGSPHAKIIVEINSDD